MPDDPRAGDSKPAARPVAAVDARRGESETGRVKRGPTLQVPRSAHGVFATLGVLAAPPAAVIGIAYYFSVKRQEALADHFGISTSVLGYSTQDYLIRGADAIFLLLLFGSLAGLLCIQIHLAVIQAVHDARHDWLRWTSVVLRVVGAVLLAVGLAAVFTPLPFHPHFLIRSLSFGLGMVLLAYGVHLANLIRATSSGSEDEADERSDAWSWSGLSVLLVVVVLLLSVFWTTKDLAQALGRDQARDLENGITALPVARVYSDRRLHIETRGVTETPLSGPAGYRFYYAGLRLLVRSGGKYFLIPDSWGQPDEMGKQEARRVVFVLPDNDTVRIEFGPGNT